MGETGIRRIAAAAPLAIVGALVLTGPVLAGPGGIVKAAVNTPVGRIALAMAAVILAPFLIYWYIRRLLKVNRTLKDLDRLARAYPRYRWLEIKDRATDAFTWIWSAWSRQKMETASQYTTHWYWQHQQLKLDELEEQGLQNVCRLIKILSMDPLYVQHNQADTGEGSRLVLQITARVIDYVRDKATGSTVQGDAQEGSISTLWTFVWETGAWRLNLIEESSQEWSYLRLPNESTLAARAVSSST